MAAPIPTTMRAVQIATYEGPAACKVVELPVPKPGSGEVLVRMHSSPINPSDNAFVRGVYGTKKQLPTVPGFEGSGTVVASGGGFMAWRLVGKRVAVVADNKKDGTWAEYMVTSAMTCLVLNDDVDFEAGSMLFVNPLTAMAFLDIVQTTGAAGVVHTAAASALGKMVQRLFKEQGLKVINVVRRDEQVAALREIGADLVLNSTAPDFKQQLKDMCKEHNIKICFDAVGGELSGEILAAMPHGSSLHLYGALSMKSLSNVEPGSLIFQDKKLVGFWLTNWLKEKGMVAKLRIFSRLQSLINGPLSSTISARYPLEKMGEALDFYKNNMSAGKVLIQPGLLPSA
eukprot:GILI01002959.1.p1 GENE.GILI01002959.1~~GILI01002959.1.p1  ORF type:complete len:343 (+),score=132.90 GILI01002959.1:165-1193(+)